MGVMKFKLPANDQAQRTPDYRKAYITGLDRTPGRLAVELRNGMMSCVRDTPESGRLFVPWPIEGHGMPIVGTATLAERIAPYMLAVELARGKLNDIRNQLSDWLQMGLRSTPDLEQALGEAACVCPMCNVDGSTRRVQRVRSRLSSIVLARRRPVDRGLHGADTPEPALLDVQAVHAPGLRPGCSSPETAIGD